MGQLTPTPRMEALGGAQRRRASDAAHDAVAACDYSTILPGSRCPSLVTWLRCHTCHRSYFAACAPSSQPYLARAGSRLQPVGPWDLRTEAAPAGRLRRGEVSHGHLG